jgi:DNA-binding NarL/FixJ family response regulator
MSVWLEASTSYSSDRPIALSEQRTDRSAPRRTGRSNLDGLLTPRELEVLRLMADGASNEAIAQELVVSRGTVKFHVKNVLRKLRVANRAEATAKYLRLELSDARV